MYTLASSGKSTPLRLIKCPYGWTRCELHTEWPLTSVVSRFSNDKVCDLHQTLREKSSEPLLADFEDIILNVIKDVKEQHDENARLHESFARLVFSAARQLECL